MKLQDPFEAMLHRYRGLLFSLCRHYCRRGLEAEDLLQEATLALWRDRERLLSLPTVQQAALTWKIGRNAMIDCLRRLKETESLPEENVLSRRTKGLSDGWGTGLCGCT